MKTIPYQIVIAVAALLLSAQARAQFDPALMQQRADPEAMKHAQQMMQQIQGNIKSGVPKEQAVNQAVDQMVKDIQAGQKQQLNSMAANLKTIKVGVSTKDDVAAKLGKPFNSAKYNDYETWSYIGGVGGDGSGAAATVQFDPSGIVTCVQAQKLGTSGTEVVYSAGKFAGMGSEVVEAVSAQGQTLVNRAATAPANPEEGQIYFNTSDKCFYGWSGASWIMLGGKQ